MRQNHTYHIYIYSNACGLHSLEADFEFTGSKTGAVQKAREEKRHLSEYGKCRLPMRYDIYDFDAEEYV